MCGRWYLRVEFQSYLFPMEPEAFTQRGTQYRCLTAQGLRPPLQSLSCLVSGSVGGAGAGIFALVRPRMNSSVEPACVFSFLWVAR